MPEKFTAFVVDRAALRELLDEASSSGRFETDPAFDLFLSTQTNFKRQ